MRTTKETVSSLLIRPGQGESHFIMQPRNIHSRAARSSISPKHNRIVKKPAVKRLWKNKCQLRLVDNVLYYHFLDKRTAEGRLLLVVPANLQAEILRNSHDITSAGHLGVKKTFHKMQQSFIWHKMRRDVQIFVQTCAMCNQNKKSNKRPKAALGHLL